MKQMHEPKRPGSGNWFEKGQDPRLPFPAFVWDSLAGTRVLSSVDFIHGENTPSGHPRHEYHISISHLGGRANREVVRAVLADFDMRGASEDNHQGSRGIARNFWLPVNRNEPAGCPCEQKEILHDEGGDYRWRDAT